MNLRSDQFLVERKHGNFTLDCRISLGELPECQTPPGGGLSLLTFTDLGECQESLIPRWAETLIDDLAALVQLLYRAQRTNQDIAA